MTLVPDPSPPVPLPPGMALSAWAQKVVSSVPVQLRSASIPLAASTEMRGIWARNKRAWLARGWSLRPEGEVWVLVQWLRSTGGELALTAVGEAKLAEFDAPRELDLDGPSSNRPVSATVKYRVPVAIAQMSASLSDKLRPYQKTPSNQIYRALSLGRSEWGYPGAADLSDCGVGKTFMDLAAALATGLRVVVLCPTVGEEGWRNAFKLFGAEPHYIGTYEALRGNYRAHIAEFDVAADRFTWKNADKIVLILDEAQACFPGEALVSTEIGLLPIQEVVARKMPLRVWSFDIKSSMATLRPIKNWFTNSPQKLLRIHHEHGTLDCTLGHRIYIDGHGWTEAQAVRKDDMLRILPCGCSQKSARPAFLREKVHDDSQDGRSLSRGPETMGGGWREGVRIAQEQEIEQLRVVQQSVCHDQQNPGFLFTGLRNEGSYRQPWREGQTASPSFGGENQERRTQADCGTQGNAFGAHEEKQPYGGRCYEGENDREHEGKAIQESGRQRDADSAANVVGDDTGVTHGSCHHRTVGGAIEISQIIPPLQSGHRRCFREAGDRSGRESPSSQKVESSGREENRDTHLSRVVRVEVLESRNRPGVEPGSGEVPLYDLEVEGNHNYFANGVLVHNCRHDTSLTVKLCKGAIRQGIPIITASATIATSPLEFRFAGRITGLHQGEHDWHRFLAAHGCQQTGQTWKWDGRLHHLVAINRRLFPDRGARVRKEDMGDECPETSIDLLPFDVPEGREIARDFEEAQEMIQSLWAQRVSPKVIAMKEQVIRMKVWHKCEMALVPYVAKHARERLIAGRSVAIFCNFNDSRMALGKLLGFKGGFFGGQNPKVRAHWEKQFQEDREFCLISNIGAGGASVSLHDVRGWRPRTAYIFPTDQVVKMVQATGRVDRLGSQSVSEQFIPFITMPLIQRMVESTRRKMLRIDTLNDGENATSKIN